MRIKTKLSLGVGLLFLLVIVLAVIGATHINKLSHDTKNILIANYNTLDYSRQMLIALDENISNPANIQNFSINLKKQQQNVTEPGEKELTDKLSADFEKLKNNPDDSMAELGLRRDLSGIMLLNMQAIQRKSGVAENTADQATFWIAVAGTLCFLIALTLLVNLPGSIAHPINELTVKIREIEEKKYNKRIYLQGSSEFVELGEAFNSMASKLEEYEGSNLSELLFEKRRIETIINNMHDPVIGLDQNSKIIFANEEAVKITGLKTGDLVGKAAAEVAMKNDLIRYLIKDIDKPAQTLTAKNQPLKIFADNKESYFEKEVHPIEITPTGEKEKEYIGHVILLKNITPFKELDFAKTNFIATVSHELKTPISSIKMSVLLLENEHTGLINTDQKNLLESIEEDANRLLKITSELLNMTQVETGNIQLNIKPTSPKEILDYAVAINKTQADQKKIKVETHFPDPLPFVLADNEKTSWVLANLISNAIRYSPDSSTISLTIEENNSGLAFIVKDQGQGIDPQYKDKIFDRYFRVPGSQKGGTGLGLAISKEFIEAQGGQISVMSSLGAGSVFRVLLNKVNT
ncbi:MAG: PAS domain-containing protein [Sphingobacteriales bacterium]|nr:PAS domain-containing protein [Sphingobacteriales bacterium]OJW01699.1 MAG: PAS domain-containing sensor histidine kinase [Sphingobacteriales bacterium 44-61]